MAFTRVWRTGLAAIVVLVAGCISRPTKTVRVGAPATTSLKLFSLERPKELQVHFIDVGQGDCTLVLLPSGKRLLVDCGSAGKGLSALAVRHYIKSVLPADDPSIDVLVITHADKDHYNLCSRVLGSPDAPEIRVGKVIVTDSIEAHSVSGTTDWLRGFDDNDVLIITDDSFNDGPVRRLPFLNEQSVSVLAANVKGDGKSNHRSIVLKITHGDFDLMLAGDATSATDLVILDRFNERLPFLDVELWKAAHHGAWATATQTRRWADVIKPEIVVYSSSFTNGFGHPSLDLAQLVRPYAIKADRHTVRFRRGGGDKEDHIEDKPFETLAHFLTSTNGTIVVTNWGDPAVVDVKISR